MIEPARRGSNSSAMTVDPEFLEQAKQLWSPTMGTESMAPLLYTLTRFTRPRRVLEIGAGHTSLFLLRALADNAEDHARTDADLQNEAAGPLVYPPYYETPYTPMLHAIDNLQHPYTTAGRVTDVAAELGLGAYLKFHHADFRGHAKSFASEDLPFDLVWMDAGSWHVYLDFLDEYWSLINPAGGLWLLHSTQTNLEGVAFVNKLKVLQATEAFNDLELVSLLEPHKLAQNSVTLIRRTTDYEENVLTRRA